MPQREQFWDYSEPRRTWTLVRRGGVFGFRVWRHGEVPEPHVHVITDRKVAGVLVYPRCCFANPRIVHELYLPAGRSMLEDIV